MTTPLVGLIDTAYIVTFTPPGGEPHTTQIMELELRDAKNFEWVSRLGCGPYLEPGGLEELPNAIRAMARDRIERKANT